MIHEDNIVSSHAQINLVAWQSEKLRLMAPLCHRNAPFFTAMTSPYALRRDG